MRQAARRSGLHILRAEIKPWSDFSPHPFHRFGFFALHLFSIQIRKGKFVLEGKMQQRAGGYYPPLRVRSLLCNTHRAIRFAEFRIADAKQNPILFFPGACITEKILLRFLSVRAMRVRAQNLPIHRRRAGMSKMNSGRSSF
ncbi:MAG: hypothetical protein IJA67_05630 [Oscillospiraceae bacterium]|nr:hypothetical protein [Oscillospiraceae bacterium]